MGNIKIKNLTKSVDIMKKSEEKEEKEENDILSFKKKLKSNLITSDGYDLSELNEKELKYFRIMYAKSGVLFLTSQPGIAKSAMMRSIAKKMKQVEIINKIVEIKEKRTTPNWQENVDVDLSGKIIAQEFFYIDLRLAMLDETDVGLFPDKTEILVKKNHQELLLAFLDHIVPKWAHYANNPDTLPKKDLNDKLPYCGSLIHFEELNRAPLSVRNAALQILLERCIGFEFEFESNVFMVSTGNLGQEDGTDVEEFDSALNGRLIHITHTMTFEEWVKYWAKDNIQSIIIKFLTIHPDLYYVGNFKRGGKDKAYATPRSWEFVSNYITSNYGFNSDPSTWFKDFLLIGHGYVGSIANQKFIKYVRDVLKISIKDVINGYPKLQSEGISFTREKKSDLLNDLKAINLSDLEDNQIENVKLFMLDLSEDELSAFLLKLIDKDFIRNQNKEIEEDENKFILDFFRDKRFTDYHNVLYDYTQKMM